MATSIDTSAFARAYQGVFQLLSPDQIEKLRSFARDEKLEKRVSYLAKRANEGELTQDEESEYQRYIEANSVLASFLAAAKHLGAVLTMTRAIFQATATAEIENDAEIDESYFLVSVIASGTVDEVVAMHHEWHQRLPTVATSDVSYFRLNMDVR